MVLNFKILTIILVVLITTLFIMIFQSKNAKFNSAQEYSPDTEYQGKVLPDDYR